MYHLQDDTNKSTDETLDVIPNTTKVTVDLVKLDENDLVPIFASEFNAPIVDETFFTGNYTFNNLVKNIRRSC